MIDPKQLMQALSVEELCRTAEEYFSAIVDPTPQMAKPFSSFIDGPVTLQMLGALLSGLHLGKTMRVLDFGAGTCWFSRQLTQLGCRTVSCDPSETALAIGRRLFAEYPIIGEPIAEPEFLRYDGRRIALPAGSVDRIVCVSAFHHVPNQAEVLAEFGRVLVDGGIAGFVEPGRYHSRSPQSQLEMRHATVLENDIILEEIFALAQPAGFTKLTCKLAADVELSLGDYTRLTGRRWNPLLDARLKHHLRRQLTERSVFFLYKGEPAPDSRGHTGLAHTIRPAGETTGAVAVGEELYLELAITNTGAARWLTENVRDIGVVKVGIHLLDGDGRLLDFDFARYRFDRPVAPGETVRKRIGVTLPEPGAYRLALDLVAEGICWFEVVGSSVVEVPVTVR